MKNFVWILTRLFLAHVAGWPGFNITTHNIQISSDTLPYPTINAPATEKSTLHEILVCSQKIKENLELNSIVLEYDEAIYAKTTEILWNHSKLGAIIP